ncbi:hypothetical protein LV779_04140 [Streptomyces thinghirensis]|nr:hypothetical protein [Streptomyces thinghirensis]
MIPAAAGEGRGGEGPEGGLLVPAPLDGTPLAERLRAPYRARWPRWWGTCGTRERAAAERAAAHAADQVRQDAERQIAQVRRESVAVARAARALRQQRRGPVGEVLGRAVSQGIGGTSRTRRTRRWWRSTTSRSRCCSRPRGTPYSPGQAVPALARHPADRHRARGHGPDRGVRADQAPRDGVRGG